MARYSGPVCRLCRREGMKLFLKGEKCFNKCLLDKRKEIPGQHGKGFRGRKASEYNKRLREKQKLKRLIGLTERPFRRYFALASKQKGLTGENLLRYLETRLDNVVHRLGFSISRAAARQMVSHGHVLVNGDAVNIPSYPLKPGDAISIKDSFKENSFLKKWREQSKSLSPLPSWLECDLDQFKGLVKNWPLRDEISFPVNDQLIVELYSK
ncbi:MAG: 30S ribosomal protein S4 [Elusimicrobia bacterium]|nr:30S ribosomal protein S4 [Elusimicrobiota bacterium]MBI3012762.1 30S ribosomal protein S4 [Elusimicrobiota bacterium]MBI4217983.1 30S ribosomal protein S4 [Elusimicrobiota bacterium]